MYPHYNVLPGAICVNLIMNKIKYVQSLRNIDMYLITKFRDSMLYGF